MLGAVLKPMPLDLLVMAVISAVKQVTLQYAVTVQKLKSFISQGKICWNHEGKVVLPSGTIIPNYVGKQLYIEQVDKWHRLNPNQLITGHLSANASLDKEQLQGMSQTFIHKVMQFNALAIGTLSQEEHVAALERELYTLHHPAEVFDGVKILRTKAYQPAPSAATNNTTTTPNTSATNDNAAPAQTSSTVKTPEPPVTNNVPMVNPSLHSYSSIPSCYQPPN